MFKTQFNSEPSKGREIIGPSQTIQGETETIEEIVKRGITKEDTKDKYDYLDNEDIETIGKEYTDPRSLDLTEIEEVRNRTNSLKEKAENMQKENEKEKQNTPEELEENENENKEIEQIKEEDK